MSDLRAAWAASTPGEWVAVRQCIDQVAPHPEGNRLLSGGNAYSDDDYSLFTEEDCRFIALAHAEVPRLLDRVEALEQLLKDAEPMIVEYMVNHPEWAKKARAQLAIAKQVQRVLARQALARQATREKEHDA